MNRRRRRRRRGGLAGLAAIFSPIPIADHSEMGKAPIQGSDTQSEREGARFRPHFEWVAASLSLDSLRSASLPSYASSRAHLASIIRKPSQFLQTKSHRGKIRDCRQSSFAQWAGSCSSFSKPGPTLNSFPSAFCISNLVFH